MMSMMAITVLALASSSSLFQEPRLDLELRRAIERTTVAIEIYDKSLEREVQMGAGSIVDELTTDDDGEWITICTAAHVLAGAESEDIQVRVLPHKHAVWIEAEVLGMPAELPPDEQEATDDVAFLRIRRSLTEFTEESLLSSVRYAPASAVQADVACWAYGYDRLNRSMGWAPGRITKAQGNEIFFSAPNVRPGWSGGPVVITLGPVGMTLRRTSVGGVSLGVGRQRVEAIAKAQEVPFSVGGDPVLNAMLSAQQLKRPLAISWHEQQRWIAVELEENDGRRFRGSWLSYGPAGAAFRGGLGGSIQIDVGGDSVKVSLTDASGSETPLPSENAPLTMRAVADPFVTGHVVLKSDHHQALYLAVPTRDCELMAVRQLLAAATAGRGMPSLEGAALEVFTMPGKVAGGQYFPFTISHFTSEWASESMTSLRTFKILESKAGSVVRLRGEIYPMNSPKRASSSSDQYWKRTRIELWDSVLDSELAELPRPEPPADSMPFDVAFEPSTRDFEFSLRRISARQGLGGYALRGLVLDYQD